MKAQIKRFKIWKRWAALSNRSKLYKVMVLLGIEQDAGFETYSAIAQFTDIIAQSVKTIAEREQDEGLG